MVPQVGDVVLVLVDPAVNNGSDCAPGMIVRVNGSLGTTNPDWGDAYSVNAKAFLDSDGADQRLSSAYLYRDEATARQCLQQFPGIRALFPKSAVVR